MARAVLLVVVLVSPAWLAAAEPELPLEYVLSAWETASRACNSYSAKFVRFEDNAFGATQARGLVRWERGGNAYYLTRAGALSWHWWSDAAALPAPTCRRQESDCSTSSIPRHFGKAEGAKLGLADAYPDMTKDEQPSDEP